MNDLIAKYLRSPFLRISVGITLLTVTILLVADVLGFFPSHSKQEMTIRKALSESFAVKVSQAISIQDADLVRRVVDEFVFENKSVISTAILDTDRKVLHEQGDHKNQWKKTRLTKSTPTHVVVPILKNAEPWGEVQIRFRALEGSLVSGTGLAAVVLFMVPLCFVAYTIFLKRVLRELNPDAVIPQRVSRALDVLSEGLLIIDQQSNIIFSNKAFCDKSGYSAIDLLGKKIDSLKWSLLDSVNAKGELPWHQVFNKGSVEEGVKLGFESISKARFTFSVNATAVTEEGRSVKGVLITFDDVTNLEKSNNELKDALSRVSTTQREIERQNKELLYLATRDPLTGVLNRRSFYESIRPLVRQSIRLGQPVSFAMVDVDFFKSVNDNYGHAMGDEVIKVVAKTLSQAAPHNALVARYGGEEFCVAMPGMDASRGSVMLERVRRCIQGLEFGDQNVFKITASSGVSQLIGDSEDIEKVIDWADQALYAAKNNGRNQVRIWQGEGQESVLFSWNTSLDLIARNGYLEPQDPDKSELDVSQNSDSNKDGSLIRNFESNMPDKGAIELGIDSPECREKDKTFGEFGSEFVESAPSLSDDANREHVLSQLIVLDRIENAIRRSNRNETHVAVLVLRLTQAHRVSDTQGIRAAESFVTLAMQRLQHILRDTDTVSLAENANDGSFSLSRMTMDEVVVLLTDLKDKAEISTILSRISKAMNFPVDVEGHEYYCQSNIGVSFSGEQEGSAEDLLSQASTALHSANQQGGVNLVEFHNEALRETLKQRIQLESELRAALVEGEVYLDFQPKADLVTGEIIGFEALARWQHPKFGLLSPDHFIPIAEQSGCVTEFTLWAIRKACIERNIWARKGARHLRVAVNISALDLKSTSFADDVLNILQEETTDPELLELEITENSLMQDIELANQTLTQLRDIGVRLAIDDFGVGYSSLSYLQRFPVHTLKIDKTFIQCFQESSEDSAIVSAIIAMGHSLGLKVVAEGAESVEDLRYLQDLECDVVQGYYVGTPLNGRDVMDYVASSGSIKNIIFEYASSQSSVFGHMDGLAGVVAEAPGRTMH